jgi:ubiquinone/menaquinone biosynthesis C-methylase UbiE
LTAVAGIAALMALGSQAAEHAAHQHSFDDPAAYARAWEDPARDAWQQPAALVEALGVEDGMAVADIGTGTGYLLPYLSAAAGPDGQVFAVDISKEMLDWVSDRAERQGLNNLETVLASGGASGLPEASVDRAIMINVWHHIEDPEAYASDLRRSLKDGGVLFIVETQPDANQPGGPPRHYRLPTEAVISRLEAAGLRASVEPFDIDRQYVIRAER